PSVSQAGSVTSMSSMTSMSSAVGHKAPKALEMIPLVRQWSSDRGLLKICRTKTPTGFFSVFTWQDRFSSGNPRPLSDFRTLRYMRQMTDTVCFTGPVSHILPVQMEFPGLCRHCASGQGSEWMGVDVLRGPGDGITGMTARTNGTTASRQSMRSQGSIAASAASVSHSVVSVQSVQSVSSVGSGSQCQSRASSARRGRQHRAPVKKSVTLEKSMDHLTEFGNFRLALYYPDAKALKLTAVTEPVSDVKALAERQEKAMHKDGLRCATYDALSVVNVQDSGYVPKELERLRTDISNLTPKGLHMMHNPDTHGKRGAKGGAGTVVAKGAEADLDFLSFSLRELISPMVHVGDPLVVRTTLLNDYLAHPVSEWYRQPFNLIGKPKAAKRTYLFALMILFANTEGIRQSDCRFAVSVTPPTMSSNSRQAPVVKVRAAMEGFRLSADKSHPVVSSFKIPEDTVDVYIHVTSDKHSGRDTDSVSDVSSESSLSLVSLQTSDRMRVGLNLSLPGLGGMADGVAIPVILRDRQLGRVQLQDKVGAEYWLSNGCYFDVLG
ncbi:hypothetical protein KIPB_007721, partial [Kipferlia bialata]